MSRAAGDFDVCPLPSAAIEGQSLGFKILGLVCRVLGFGFSNFFFA